jgi:signal peptidase
MKKIAEITTIVVAVLLIATTSLIYLSARMGFQVNTVISDSMSPTLSVGTMVVSRAPVVANLKVGDVIVFKPVTVGEKPIVHRIVEVGNTNPPTFKTKGDNVTQTVDPWVVPAANVIGKMEFNSPVAGYINSFFRTKAGLIIALILPALILVVMLFKSFWRELVKYIRNTPAKASK